mgnify:CR=1 FL=1
MANWEELTWRVSDATYAAWCAHDPDAVAAVFAEDARTRDAGTETWEIGRAAVRDRAAVLLAGFSDFRLERQILVIEGARHADRWIMTGTHDGELLGVEATGNAVRVEGGTFTLLDEAGLVAEDVHFVDYASLFRQLGVG